MHSKTHIITLRCHWRKVLKGNPTQAQLEAYLQDLKAYEHLKRK
jgi:hypothetical protein